MHYDVVVVGGSYSGMAAALQLVRARRSVLVIDEGLRRNRFAATSHGLLGQDGFDPATIARSARQQLEAYPTLSWIETTAIGIEGELDNFTVVTDEAERVECNRVLLATGVRDKLPTIEGLAERWGKSVFHCPYCHGYELNRGRIGVLATGPMASHQAELLTEWGDVTLLTTAAVNLEVSVEEGLAARSVEIEHTPVERLNGVADVLLSDGRTLSFAGLFLASWCEPAPLATETGCDLEEMPMGLQIRVDATNETSVPGIFACGDGASAPHSISVAISSGSIAGLQIHRSLVWPSARA
jgi:thioredoxin reductase